MDQFPTNQPVPPSQPAQPITPQPAETQAQVEPSPSVVSSPAAEAPVTEPVTAPVDVPVPTLEESTVSIAASEAAAPSMTLPTDAAFDDSPALDGELVDDGADTEPAFIWEASEYIHHDKGGMWYVILAIVLIALLAIAYFTHQWLSIGVFIVMAIAVVVYARKPPRTLTYELSQDAISIDGHPYPFSQFRSFAVLSDIAWHTIDLEPTQRFMPRLAILFEDESFDSIVDHLQDHLPRVDRKPDAVERLTRYLRF